MDMFHMPHGQSFWISLYPSLISRFVGERLSSRTLGCKLLCSTCCKAGTEQLANREGVGGGSREVIGRSSSPHTPRKINRHVSQLQAYIAYTSINNRQFIADSSPLVIVGKVRGSDTRRAAGGNREQHMLDKLPEIITAFAAILWPVIVVLLILLYRSSVRKLIESAEKREWTMEIGGQKLSMKELTTQQTSLIADLQKQLGDLQKQVQTPSGTALTTEQQTPSSDGNRPFAVLW